jgi:hypothetical protein
MGVEVWNEVNCRQMHDNLRLYTLQRSFDISAMANVDLEKPVIRNGSELPTTERQIVDDKGNVSARRKQLG